MTTEEFLKDVCPNHTDKSQWNKSELLHILELHKEQLRLHDTAGRSEQLSCEYCKGDANPTCCDNCLERMVDSM